MERKTAKELGMKEGNKFVVGAGHGMEGVLHIGEVVTLDYDDGSCCPEFRRENGSTLYAYASAMKPYAGQVVEAVDYHVSVSGDDEGGATTTIVIQKRLSIEEIQAVLKAAGV